MFSNRKGHKYLFVNVDSTGGTLCAAILNAATGEAYPGFDLDDCVNIENVDSTRHMLAWKDRVTLPHFEGAIQFKFALSGSTRLFSFWISASRCGESNGFGAAGGPEFVGDEGRDHRGGC